MFESQHISQGFGCIELMQVLWEKILNLKKVGKKWWRFGRSKRKGEPIKLTHNHFHRSWKMLQNKKWSFGKWNSFNGLKGCSFN